MFPVSAEFEQQLRQSHQAVSKVEVYNPDGVLSLEFLLTGGQVQVDRTAKVRRRASVVGPGISTTGENLVPRDLVVVQQGLQNYGAQAATFGAEGDVYGASASDTVSFTGLLAPFGTTFRPYRGVVLSDGSTEWVPLGIFLLEQSSIEDRDGVLYVELAGPDETQRFVEARWPEPYQVPAGLTHDTAIQQLLDNRVPGFTYDLPSTSRTTPQLVFGDDPETDPLADAAGIARSVGWELYGDLDGTVVAREEPGADGEPVWHFVEGEQCGVTELRRMLSRRDTFNGVVVTGETADGDAPIRATAWDDNPDSPTNRASYGEVPAFYSSKLITTTAQAQDTANAELRRRIGIDEQVQLLGVPVPHLDAGDVVYIKRRASRLDAAFVVQRITMPLNPEGEMVAECRRARDLEGGS